MGESSVEFLCLHRKNGITHLQSPQWTCLMLLQISLIIVWNFELYMLPFSLLLLFARNALIEYRRGRLGKSFATLGDEVRCSNGLAERFSIDDFSRRFPQWYRPGNIDEDILEGDGSIKVGEQVRSREKKCIWWVLGTEEIIAWRHSWYSRYSARNPRLCRWSGVNSRAGEKVRDYDALSDRSETFFPLVCLILRFLGYLSLLLSSWRLFPPYSTTFLFGIWFWRLLSISSPNAFENRRIMSITMNWPISSLGCLRTLNWSVVASLSLCRADNWIDVPFF